MELVASSSSGWIREEVIRSLPRDTLILMTLDADPLATNSIKYPNVELVTDALAWMSDLVVPLRSSRSSCHRLLQCLDLPYSIDNPFVRLSNIHDQECIELESLEGRRLSTSLAEVVKSNSPGRSH